MGLWTMTHFWAIVPVFIGFAGIAYLLARFLKDKGKNVKYIPLKVIALIIIGLEIAKQTVSICRGYDLYHLPFHYCSLFLYLLPVHAFSKGKVKRFFDAITFGCCASLVLFLMIMPTVVYSDTAILEFFEEFFSFHTLAFHHLVVLYFFIAMALDTFTLEMKKDFKSLAIALSAYVALAIVLSYTLEVNFQNLRTCNLGIGEEIRVAINGALGWFGQALYVFVLFALTTLFAFLSYYLAHLFNTRVLKRGAKEKVS